MFLHLILVVHFPHEKYVNNEYFPNYNNPQNPTFSWSSLISSKVMETVIASTLSMLYIVAYEWLLQGTMLS